MRTIAELLEDSPFFAGLDAQALAVFAGCAQTARFDTGELLFRAGQPADTFYVIRHGLVSIEMHAPAKGAVTLTTLDDGEVVGWSWLIPPYVWVFDARAAAPTSAVSFDGACLRAKCDADPALGYALMQRVSQMMYERLQATRVQLLDLYGDAS
ncbi:MAG TPA: cyclic nucleotide-binding domain-containing protein [Actinomycetota bacterium]|nr:cyclic nucleotide-binding domain-containing protein [Actinomycetota bacterium]